LVDHVFEQRPFRRRRIDRQSLAKAGAASAADRLARSTSFEAGSSEDDARRPGRVRARLRLPQHDHLC
jgi:hypothetical protein